MRTAKVTLTSTILAAALGLALGLAAAPAMADKPVEGVHGHGGDNGDELATPLDVIINNVSGPVDDQPVCLGSAVPPQTVLAVDVDRDCTITMNSIKVLGDADGLLSLFRVEVRTRKNRGTDIQLCFSTNETHSPGNENEVYCADRLNATVCIESLEPDTRIYLTPLFSGGGVPLRKLHQPFKGQTTGEDLISVGEICYTAQGEGLRCDDARPNCAPL